MTAVPARLELDVGCTASPDELHDLLASGLGFPGYYGRNWDAFWDCIRDPEQSSMPSVLVLRGWPLLERRLPRNAQLMKSCLDDLPKERPECRIVWG